MWKEISKILNAYREKIIFLRVEFYLFNINMEWIFIY